MAKPKYHKDERRTWQDTLHALKTSHTTSLRQACEMLRARRTFLSQFILPSVDSIYLSTGKQGRVRVGVNWLAAADSQVGVDRSCSTWLCTKELLDLFAGSVKTCTRQTILIPWQLFIKEELWPEYQRNYDAINNEINSLLHKMDSASSLDCKEIVARIDGLREKREMLFDACAKQDDATQELIAAESPDYSRRAGVKRVPVPVPRYASYDEMKRTMLKRDKNNPWSNPWNTVPDITDFGDSNEQIYRELFKRGYVRLECSFESCEPDGKPGTITYYLKPDYLEEDGLLSSLTDRPNLVKLTAYEDWARYKQRIMEAPGD